MPAAAELLEDEDEFHSSLRIYLNAVEMLASSPKEQCRQMGDYNVAWELKEDVQNGKFLVGRGYLDETEEQWINALSSALEGVNTQALPAGGGRDVNLQAMSFLVWEPTRYLAAEVLRRLSHGAKRNVAYLGLPDSAA
ncbi:MAG TPA: hypothetical protein DEP36_10415 [Gammaproteobacteria bacterium]|nr:hypothetical protein [Gammaproteobacteria bacterium]HCB13964.1 hypothetical protein [Gammaproteobacteria bacterium]